MQSVTLVSCYFFYQILKVFITYNFLELNFKFIIFHIFLMQRIVTFLAIYPPCNYTISSQSFLCKFQFHPLLTVVLNQKKLKQTSSPLPQPLVLSIVALMLLYQYQVCLNSWKMRFYFGEVQSRL